MTKRYEVSYLLADMLLAGYYFLELNYLLSDRQVEVKPDTKFLVSAECSRSLPKKDSGYNTEIAEVTRLTEWAIMSSGFNQQRRAFSDESRLDKQTEGAVLSTVRSR